MDGPEEQGAVPGSSGLHCARGEQQRGGFLVTCHGKQCFIIIIIHKAAVKYSTQTF